MVSIPWHWFFKSIFLKYFNELPKEENYILAPQAPSKYYLKNEYKHVGASWLTKENTAIETENLFNYLDAVLENENLPDCEIIVFGFSQGVSISLRYLTYSKLQCSKLIIYAGGIPKELNKTDFSYFENKTEIVSIIGDHDEYLTPKRLEEENRKLNSLFGNNIRHINFKGAHEVKKEIINQLAI